MDNLVFMTDMKIIDNKKIVLDKEYSQVFKLSDNSEISISSTVGLTRCEQEDSLLVITKGKYILMLVADGMGGLNNGEGASYSRVNTIKKYFSYEKEEYLRILDDILLEEVMYLIIEDVVSKIRCDSGTTLSMALVLDDVTYIVNIGDSRIYSLNNNTFRFITKDDSEGFDRFNPRNRQDRDKLRFYRYNNLITNCIMKNALIKLNIKEIYNDKYDSLCILTDGVSDILKEKEIKECLKKEKSAYLLTELSKYHQIEVNKEIENDTDDYLKKIYPGCDNASAIVYKKVRRK